MSLTTREIRQTFLEFFEKRSHQIVPSAPIVLKDDPTLMFTNAGMNQFKGIFIGNEEAKSSRVSDTQKCLRVSGKHNDLEEVGKDHYHHTMFEMLGNWSFGDYFKKDAISFAWELLVDTYQLDPERMYVSVFEGDEALGLEVDEEAVELWKNHVDPSRILRFGRKDNFWEMGETGPCGPCSEIHYDMRSDAERERVSGASLVNQDDPEVIEIWNLVFMQFSRMEDGSLIPLKAKHIDTGMGLERLARALQGKRSNYDIDLFAHIIQKIESLTGREYRKGDTREDIAFRVIADHLRAISFCIADGQIPGNNGAGYVVRRVLRRAIRYGYSELGMSEPFIFKAFEALVEVMGDDFQELHRNKVLIQKVIQEEESTFLRTLDKGLSRLAGHFEVDSTHKVLDGAVAFELYDTYGFPIDLTQLIAGEHDWSVDMKGFQEHLNQQKDRSRKASKASFGDWNVQNEDTNSLFVGYDQTTNHTSIAKYRTSNIKGKDVVQVVLNETPFYAESGGQVGDKGKLVVDGEEIAVFDTKKENGEIIHYCNALPKNTDAEVIAVVDVSRRRDTMKNHSATHLLHYALRKELGDHVEQKGSLVAPNRLRFDFSHFEKISDAQLQKIESDVMEMIESQIPLDELRDVPIDEAKSMGAMALFGEKYGDRVRVIRFGQSVELCGGTHVGNSGEIQGFKLVSEGSVASGVRRVEAITGVAYKNHLREIEANYQKLEELLGHPKDVIETVRRLQEELKLTQKEVQAHQEREKSALLDQWSSAFESRDDYSVLIKSIKGIEGKLVKDMVYQMTLQADDRIAIIVGEADEKPFIVVGASKALAQSKGIDASKWVRSLAEHINGGGGGQPFLAMAGGKNSQGLQRALEHADEISRI